MQRFVILEHTGAPDDPAGRHFDLLLEDGGSCRTWRLAALPEPGGPPVEALELAPHRLAWLDHEVGEVSGGRGFARRVDGGAYEPTSADAFGATCVDVTLAGTHGVRRLILSAQGDGWLAVTPGGDAAS